MAKTMGECPSCKKKGVTITDVRETKYNGILATIRRRKVCSKCGFSFTTYEIPAIMLGADVFFSKWDEYIKQFKEMSTFLKND